MGIKITIAGKEVVSPEFKLLKMKNENTFIFALSNILPDEEEFITNSINSDNLNFILEEEYLILELENKHYCFDFLRFPKTNIKDLISVDNYNIGFVFFDLDGKIKEGEVKTFNIK